MGLGRKNTNINVKNNSGGDDPPGGGGGGPQMKQKLRVGESAGEGKGQE